jgi:putative transposase
MIQDHQLSERHACRLVGLSRDSYRNPPQPDQLSRDLRERIVDIANLRRRFTLCLKVVKLYWTFALEA